MLREKYDMCDTLTYMAFIINQLDEEAVYDVSSECRKSNREDTSVVTLMDS
jgi:hypothetical protein